MSFRSFGGEFTRGPRISLAGKSKTTDASRDQTLEIVRKQREQRKQTKLENKSATDIQVRPVTSCANAATITTFAADYIPTCVFGPVCRRRGAPTAADKGPRPNLDRNGSKDTVRWGSMLRGSFLSCQLAACIYSGQGAKFNTAYLFAPAFAVTIWRQTVLSSGSFASSQTQLPH
jgi:hypothetical protein